MTLFSFLTAPGFTHAEFSVTCRVMRDLFPLLPDCGDMACDELILAVLAYLVDGMPLPQALIEECYPPEPRITLDRTLAVDARGQFLMERDDPRSVYVFASGGSEVTVSRLMDFREMPADVKLCADEAYHRHRAAIDEIHRELTAHEGHAHA